MQPIGDRRQYRTRGPNTGCASGLAGTDRRFAAAVRSTNLLYTRYRMSDQIVVELRAHYLCSAQEPVMIPEWGTTLGGGHPGTALICVRILRGGYNSGPGLAALNQKSLTGR